MDTFHLFVFGYWICGDIYGEKKDININNVEGQKFFFVCVLSWLFVMLFVHLVLNLKFSRTNPIIGVSISLSFNNSNMLLWNQHKI